MLEKLKELEGPIAALRTRVANLEQAVGEQPGMALENSIEFDSIKLDLDNLEGKRRELEPPAGEPPAGEPPAGEPPTGEAPPSKEETLTEKADSIITYYALWAAGAGVIPLPFLDVVGIAALQGKMLDDLYKNYYKPDPARPNEPTGFSKKFNKNLLIAVVGSFGPEFLFAGALATAMKFIPIIGALPAGGAVSAIGGLSTFVVGKLVKEDLEKGLTPEAIVDSLSRLNTRDPRVRVLRKEWESISKKGQPTVATAK